MKRIYFVFGFLFLIHQADAVLDPDRPEAKPNLELSWVKSKIRNLGDFLGLERLGFQALKQENEQYIRNVVTALGMENYCIEIRGMSNYSQRVNGCEQSDGYSAYVLPSTVFNKTSHAYLHVWPSVIFNKKSHAYLFVNEEWFEHLSEQEKQAVIRHELMHLKHNHIRNQFVLGFVAGMFLYILSSSINSMIDSSFPDNSKSSKFCGKLCSGIVLWPVISLLAKYSRMCEKEADIEAVKTMENKEGFIDLFNNMKIHIEDPESKFGIKRILDRMRKWVGQYFSTHPRLDERIKYIQTLEAA